MASNAGKSAFPRNGHMVPDGWGGQELASAREGMTLREYMATKIAAAYRAHHGGQGSPAEVATLALLDADALIAALAES